MNPRIRFPLLILSVLVASFVAVIGFAQKKNAIPFPTGYRSWNLVKTMVIFSNQHPLFNKFGGLHNVYVNDVGLPSLQEGRAYRDGSVLVFDLLDIRTYRGAIETRGRKFVAVMKKDSKHYPNTGGWGFEVFKGNQQVGSLQDMKSCFDCHASQKRVDYVYSTYTK